jgi:hypothetical protein
MHRILEWSPVVFAFAFIFAFDAWQAEREKRKRAEGERDWRRADARNCVKLLREANAVLVELANSAGECGRLLAAWDVASKAWNLAGANEHEAEALDRLNGTLARFQEYAKKNNLAITEREEHEKCK